MRAIVYLSLAVASIVTGIGQLGWWVIKQYLRIVKDDDA